MSKFYFYKHENAEILVLGNYLINQVSEGFTLTNSDIDSFKEIIDRHFADTPWVYISNRVFSYAVNPMVYKMASSAPNLLGVAIIAKERSKKQAAEFEKCFAEIPVIVLSTLTQALSWSDALCATYAQNKRDKISATNA